MTICATFLEAAAPPYYSLDDLGENSRSGSPRRPSAFAAQNDTPPNTVVPQPPLHSDPKARRIQAIANTAGFHFAFIEQGGSSLYSTLALKVTNLEGLRIVISLGGVEEDPFSLWHDKAGNPVAQPLAGVTDPETGLRFPDFNDSSTFPSEEFQTTLSLPEPAEFLRPGFPAVSIIRPTSTVRASAVAAIQSFTDDLLFAGQTPEFIETVMELARATDAAQREEIRGQPHSLATSPRVWRLRTSPPGPLSHKERGHPNRERRDCLDARSMGW